MKRILITLKESAYNDFLNQNKKYEYRKRWPNEKVIAYIYAKGIEKSIVMKIEFDKPIYKKKEEIALIAKSEHEDWYQGTLDYLNNYEYGYAIEALKISKIKNPKSLGEMKEKCLMPPQNYQYLTDDIIEWIEE